MRYNKNASQKVIVSIKTSHGLYRGIKKAFSARGEKAFFVFFLIYPTMNPVFFLTSSSEGSRYSSAVYDNAALSFSSRGGRISVL